MCIQFFKGNRSKLQHIASSVLYFDVDAQDEKENPPTHSLIRLELAMVFKNSKAFTYATKTKDGNRKDFFISVMLLDKGVNLPILL